MPSGSHGLRWETRGERLAVGCLDGSLWIWDLTSDPPRVLARLYARPEGGVLAVTGDGRVAGTDDQALEVVRFADRWALYDVTDVPGRVLPFEQIAEHLRRPSDSRTAPAEQGHTPRPRSRRPSKRRAP